MVQANNSRLPFYTWMTVIAVGLVIGIYGAVQALAKGQGVTMATTDQMPWGILIAAYEFFAIMSVGLCLVASIGYVFGVKSFQLIAKRAVFLGIIALLCGYIPLILELGNPLRILNFLISPNTSSAMWWMSVLYTLYLVFMLILFYQLNRQGNVRTIGTLALIAGIVALGAIGALFGFAEARPAFGGALMPIYIVVSALVSGAALLALATIVEYKATNKEMGSELSSLVTADMGKLLALVLGIAFFIAIWKDLIGLYSPGTAESEAYRYTLFGPGAFRYWGLEIVIGLVIPFFILLNAGTRNVKGMMTASTLVLIGMFAAKYNFVFGGQQVVPMLQWQPRFVSYSPTFVEFSIVILAFAVLALLYTLGNRIFALQEVPQ